MKFKLEDLELRIDFSRNKTGLSVVTECSIKDQYNVPILTGTASVNTGKYNLCKETGRKISLTRAIANLSKADRTIIWQAYFSRKQNHLLPINYLQNV